MQAVQKIGTSTNDGYSRRTYTTAGTTLTIMFGCAPGGMTTLDFDATPTQYTTYNDTAKLVNVFTKQ